MTTSTKEDMALIAHLFRRAGFGANYDELEHYTAMGYEQTVEELINPENQPSIQEDLMVRRMPVWGDYLFLNMNQAQWVHRMVVTQRPLEEKIALFWHGVLCIGYGKVDSPKQISPSIERLRNNGLGSFRDLLIQVAEDPAMMQYLDNNMSHRNAVNENWGRELLELFSLGVGNYTEDDIKEAARAFTGWGVAPTPPVFPWGRSFWEFLYDDSEHDDGEKEFLGQKGRFTGEDVIDIICQQPSTAQFISRHLYNFFVADEPGVPSWPYTPPLDPEAIESLTNVYFDSNYNIKAMLRALFNSEYFKRTRFSKVKSPAELVAATVRLTQDHDVPAPGLSDLSNACKYMGQDLLNPPTVEGWHTGVEWIDSGSLVERINFAGNYLGDVTKPRILAIVERLSSKGETLEAEEFVDGCLEQLGMIFLAEPTRQALIESARQHGIVVTRTEEFARRTGEMLQLIGASKEYQLC